MSRLFFSYLIHEVLTYLPLCVFFTCSLPKFDLEVKAIKNFVTLFHPAETVSYPGIWLEPEQTNKNGEEK